VAEGRQDILLDLYGGAGGIAFTCSDLAREVWSVEEVAPATEDGRHNAGLNGIGNVQFETADVRAWLKRYLAGGATGDGITVVADPPRAGLHPKVLKRLVALQPERLVYVSCNPKILARECDALSEGFRLTRMAAVDLFPHTRHVEALALFERKAVS
jgi:23S rRNA (uracil1939-C5)-methyltransferase